MCHSRLTPSEQYLSRKVLACVNATIWSSLFTVGNFLYGRIGYALGCLAVFDVAGAALIWVVNRVWQHPGMVEIGDTTVPETAVS